MEGQKIPSSRDILGHVNNYKAVVCRTTNEPARCRYLAYGRPLSAQRSEKDRDSRALRSSHREKDRAPRRRGVSMLPEDSHDSCAVLPLRHTETRTELFGRDPSRSFVSDIRRNLERAPLFRRAASRSASQPVAWISSAQ